MNIKKLIKLAIISTAVMASFVFAKVNINTATVDELSALYGIGEGKAKAIIAYRNKNGTFKSIEELANVKGIGKKTVAKLSKDIKLTGKTTLDDLSKKTKATTKAKKSTKDSKASKVKASKSAKKKATSQKSVTKKVKKASTQKKTNKKSKSDKKKDSKKAD